MAQGKEFSEVKLIYQEYKEILGQIASLDRRENNTST
jgi:hypothetical protein